MALGAIHAQGVLGTPGECPNEIRRQEQGAAALALPECRAYEVVTPPVKGSGEAVAAEFGEIREGREVAPLRPDHLFATFGARTSLSGGRMAWLSDPVPLAESAGIDYLATRTEDGWQSTGLVPPMSVFNDITCPLELGVSTWSPDLSHSVLDLPAGPPRGFYYESECGQDEPRLAPGEPEHFRNLFVHDNGSGSNELVNVTPSDVVWPEPERKFQRYWPASFLAGSDDLSHVVFEEELKLTPEAPIGYRGGDELYEWSAGQVRLVTILPDGTPVHGSLAGATRNHEAPSSDPAVNSNTQASNVAQFRHAVSADGSRVFFEAPGDEGEGDLYLRKDGVSTIQIDAAEAGCASCASGGGDFQAASADGSRVFFADENKLTADSTAAAGRADLYEYDVESGALTDLTVNTVNASEPADVLGVIGTNEGTQEEDGSPYVYFAAMGDLTGAQQNSYGDTALTPAEGNGELKGGGKGKGNLTAGSNRVTGFSVTSGEFFLGQEIEGAGLNRGTTVTSCSSGCAAPTELTLSQDARETETGQTLTGFGHKEVTGVATTSGAGAFAVGMAISGPGIRPRTWITAVGSGTLTLSKGVTESGTKTLSATAANLYLRHAGATSFVAALDPATDDCNWTWNARCGGGDVASGLTARTATTGRYLGFNSARSLTGYDNIDVNTGEPDIEIFLYDADRNELACASCAPSGARPLAGSAIHYPAFAGREEGWGDTYLQRNVSNNGQVFFETADALLPRDGNGRRDVYEYVDGHPHLISTGAGEDGSYFLDATPDGSSVFFGTAQQLLPSDIDKAADIYVARVDGGFPEPPQPVECEGEACRGAGTSGESLSPGSSSLISPPNPLHCHRGFVKRHGHCVRARRHKRRHHRRAARHHRAVRHNRRAGK